MAEITLADVTLTLAKNDISFAAGRYLTFPSVAFGDSALTYPATGVPLPAIASLGPFKKSAQLVMVVPVTIDGYIYKYDATNHSLRIFQSAGTAAPLAELSGTALPAKVIKLMVVGH